MIGVHLLSEEVLKWCRFQNEIIGVHLLLVGTSSVLVCMIGVHLLSVQVVYLVENETLSLHLLSVGTSSRFSQNK